MTEWVIVWDVGYDGYDSSYKALPVDDDGFLIGYGYGPFLIDPDFSDEMPPIVPGGSRLVYIETQQPRYPSQEAAERAIAFNALGGRNL